MTPRPDGDRLVALEGLRGVAAAAILLQHFFVINGAGAAFRFTRHLEVGVPVFFALSGFLLYRPWAAGRSSDLGRYFRRRLLRIVPAYWIALSVSVAAGLVAMGPDPWTYYGFLQTYSTRTFFNGIAPAWSLCVEMSFYVALPVIALSVRRLRTRWQLALGLVASISALAIRALTVKSDPPLSFTVLGTFDWFVVGMLTAKVWTVRWSIFERISPGLLTGGAVALFLVVGAVDLPWGAFTHPAPRPLPWAVQHVAYGMIAALLLLAALAAERRRSVVAAALKSRLGHCLGQVSYGVFLWHLPVIYLVGKLARHGYPSAWGAQLVAVVALTLAAASASWYGVERNLLAMRRAVSPDQDHGIAQRGRIPPAEQPAEQPA